MNTNNTATSDNRKKKEAIVAEVSEKINRAKGMVFTNYQGLTHQQLEGFKRELKKVDAEFSVIKNTLIKRSLAGKKLDDEAQKAFEQPTGTLFMYSDVVEPLKALAKTIKSFNLPAIKFGLIGDAVTSESDIIRLSTLPSRDTLRAQVLGMMKSPVQGLHRALSWNMQKFVMTLSAIAEKKS